MMSNTFNAFTAQHPLGSLASLLLLLVLVTMGMIWVSEGYKSRASESRRLGFVHDLGEVDSESRAQIMVTRMLDDLMRLTALEQVIALKLVGGVLFQVAQSSHGTLFTTGWPASEDRNSYLIERTASGPWIEEVDGRATGPSEPAVFGDEEIRSRVTAMAYAAARDSEGALAGILVLAAAGRTRGEAVGRLSAVMPALVDYASLAGALFSQNLGRAELLRAEVASIKAIIDGQAFHPVFQPIRVAKTMRVIGYEALTRFDFGGNPAEVFARARAVGVGEELEFKVIEHGLAQSELLLPRQAFLSVNVSPDLLLGQAKELNLLLRQSRREIVLELTEHLPIQQYAELRAALGHFDPRPRLAVDDAGAGYASLQHILELRPDYIKLDWSLTGGLRVDLAKQALMTGMVGFADSIGAQLVAEGVESRDELKALRRLGVELAQGYLLGRPERSSTYSKSDNGPPQLDPGQRPQAVITRPLRRSGAGNADG